MIENKNADVFISIIWDSFVFVGAGGTSPTPDESCRRKTKLADTLVRMIMRRQQRRVCRSIYYGGGTLETLLISKSTSQSHPGVKKKKKIRA